mgnify:CR=1 FL=1
MLKVTKDIINNLWCKNPITPVVIRNPMSKKSSNNIKFEEVDVWEEIYLEKGNVGIYAAYEPYSDFYMIIYNDVPIKEFYKSENDICVRAAELGIVLSK